MTDSTDRMRSPLCLHTARPRARTAPSTMLSPACWHHSMHCRRGPGLGWRHKPLYLQVNRILSTYHQPCSHGLCSHPEGSHNPITGCIIRS